jgi:small-conductance mechanosensitive channel
MGITVSILFIAAGAIMRWAVTATTDGFNIHTAGMILFIIGIVGAVVSLAFWSSWGGFRSRSMMVDNRSVVVDDPSVVATRRAAPVARVDTTPVARVDAAGRPLVEDRIVEERVEQY